jgi:uncharacterized protein YdiU (UPF0061 family)
LSALAPLVPAYADAPGLAARADPAPVAAPRMLALNEAHAAQLGLDPGALHAAPGVFTGNEAWPGAAPVATAYAGHQFGGFVPQLGDGRAHLLGLAEGPNGPVEIQTKGSGPTIFSRGGDGRAWLGPVLREYVLSEAMHAFGVPTTRALAAVATGEDVLRQEGPLPGAVLVRTAPSHLRVGTFQYFAVRGDEDALRALADLAVRRHHPEADGPADLLRAAVAAQARLVARWMSLGFVHGVMNTDNAHVGGLTIDYGPCAFLDAYHPAKVFSSIDVQGRYAYGRQPSIAAWNMAQLATSLLPLMGGEAGIPEAQAAVDGFAGTYQAEWLRLFRAKLGLRGEEEGDLALIEGLLDRMAAARTDFTVAFRDLAGAAEGSPMPEACGDWEAGWRARLAREDGDAPALMRAHSPSVIPRNHRIEAMIAAAARGDMAPFDEMLRAVATPYEDGPLTADYARPPAPGEEVAATFCGT